MRVLLGLCPPPPAVGIAPLARGCCGALLVCLGAAAPPLPRPSPRPRGGGGFPAGVRSACKRLPLGAGYAPPATVCRGLPLRPAAVWARKRAPCIIGLQAAPCSPAAVWAQAALRLCSRPLSCPLPLAAAARYAAPLQKHIKTAAKSIKKASKSPLFVRHIAASVPVCVNGQYADKPHVVGIIGQPLTLHKAKNAILSPPHGGGLHPLGRGAKPNCPAVKAAAACTRHKCRSQNKNVQSHK